MNPQPKSGQITASSSPRTGGLKEWAPTVNLLGYKDLGPALKGKIVVSVIAPMKFERGKGASAVEVEAGSAAVVEDSPNGLKAALAAGIRTVVVPNPLVESLNFSGAFARYKSLDVLPAGELLDLVFGQLN